jgi:predicted nucleic acid-binding protein
MSGSDAFFADTNLLVYSAGSADPEKNQMARRWVNALWSSGSGRLSYQVLHEFYATAVKKSAPVAEARESVLLWSAWQPVEMSMTLIERGWHWMDTARISYWDALIVSAAELSGCRWLLTEDLQDGRTYETVTVVNPFRVSPEQFGIEAP